MFSYLFKPGKIGKLELKNRLVMPAMGNRLADDKGYVNQQMIDYYVERAKGGVGLIITQYARVTTDAAYPKGMSISDDEFIPGLSDLVKAVHQNGARIAIQLAHLGPIMMAVGRPSGADIMVPSLLPWMKEKGGFREMTLAEIDQYEEAFAEAVRRAKEAGFDAVDLHGCHGCLVTAFLSPAMNYRSDDYGGSTENRARFACRILSRARQKVGPDFPLIFRINGDDYYEGGTDIKEAIRHAKLLEQAGADAISVSAGLEFWSPQTLPCYLYRTGILTPLAAEVKKAVKVPVITAGKIDLLLGDGIIKDGKADFVALGRSLLADSYLPNKAREGRLEEIRQCIYCNNCLYPGRDGIRSCTVNPFLLRESEYPPKQAAIKKRVMVVGGGLAGMQASVVLRQRGHDVSLYEREDKLGGQWRIASAMKPKKAFATLTDRLSKDMAQAGVGIFLKTHVTRELVSKMSPDVVVLATGATPLTLAVPGNQRKNVVQANDVIMGRVEVGRRVVVIGGRFLGMEMAIDMAEKGKEVAMVSRGRIGGKKRPFERSTYKTLLERLIKLRIPLYPNSTVLDINDKGVNIEHDEGGFLLEADTVILAVGTRNENSLADDLKNIVPEFYQIGDCAGPEDARTATYEATTVALKI